MISSILAGALLVLSPPLALSLPAGDIKLNRKNVLEGTWRGKANVESGKSKGQTWSWVIEFPEGDPSKATGTAINKITEVKADRFSIKKPFKMRILYSVGQGMTYEVQTTTRLDPTCSKMTGDFNNVMGKGTFELEKEDCAPPNEVVKGTWKGILEGAKGHSKKSPLEIEIAASSGLEKAQVSLGELKVKRVVPSYWKASTRDVVFFLEIGDGKSRKKSRARYLKIAGNFGADGTFTGTFDEKKVGKGDLSLKRE